MTKSLRQGYGEAVLVHEWVEGVMYVGCERRNGSRELRRVSVEWWYAAWYAHRGCVVALPRLHVI